MLWHGLHGKAGSCIGLSCVKETWQLGKVLNFLPIYVDAELPRELFSHKYVDVVLTQKGEMCW